MFIFFEEMVVADINIAWKGRQLFERDRTLDIDDASYVEEGVVSVDISQYNRHDQAHEEEEEEERVHFSDSD